MDLMHLRTNEKKLRGKPLRTSFFACLAGAVLLQSGVQMTVVEGPSMNPTLHSGQRLLMSRWPGLLGVHDGDIIVFRKNGANYIKRVYRTAGEYVDAMHRPSYVPGIPFRVPQQTVYCLGDNPQNSEDSRMFGPIPAASIVGKIVAY